MKRSRMRWAIPIGGGLLSAILVVAITPHVMLPLRILLGIVALACIGGQSAAYLWSSASDQGD